MKIVAVCCDGGSRFNPGNSAYGCVLYEVESSFSSQISGEFISTLTPVLEIGEYLGIATNNEAEWSGAVEGVRAAIKNYGTEIDLRILLDSELVVKQIKKEYKVKQEHLKPYFEEIYNLLNQVSSWQVQHIYRKFNSRADVIVNQILDQQAQKQK